MGKKERFCLEIKRFEKLQKIRLDLTQFTVSTVFQYLFFFSFFLSIFSSAGHTCLYGEFFDHNVSFNPRMFTRQFFNRINGKHPRFPAFVRVKRLGKFFINKPSIFQHFQGHLLVQWCCRVLLVTCKFSAKEITVSL